MAALVTAGFPGTRGNVTRKLLSHRRQAANTVGSHVYTVVSGLCMGSTLDSYSCFPNQSVESAAGTGTLTPLCLECRKDGIPCTTMTTYERGETEGRRRGKARRREISIWSVFKNY